LIWCRDLSPFFADIPASCHRMAKRSLYLGSGQGSPSFRSLM
jgi:hypothetical protein